MAWNSARASDERTENGFPNEGKSRRQDWLSAWSGCSMRGSPVHASPQPAQCKLGSIRHLLTEAVAFTSFLLAPCWHPCPSPAEDMFQSPRTNTGITEDLLVSTQRDSALCCLSHCGERYMSGGRSLLTFSLGEAQRKPLLHTQPNAAAGNHLQIKWLAPGTCWPHP